MQIEQTYHTKKFVQNRTKVTGLIICYWVKLGILDTKIVEAEDKLQPIYFVIEEKVREFYEC